jgi:hypothetical protein
MAVFAFLAEETQVDLRLGMAIHTKSRSPTEALLDMAPLTGNLRMPALEGKDFIVIETLHAINPVVAVEACGPEQTLMLSNELVVCTGMASRAGFWRKTLYFPRMAAVT